MLGFRQRLVSASKGGVPPAPLAEWWGVLILHDPLIHVAVVASHGVIVPEVDKITLHGATARAQAVKEGFPLLNAKCKVVEEGTIHQDERVFLDISGLVGVEIVEPEGMASAAAETGLFRIA